MAPVPRGARRAAWIPVPGLIRARSAAAAHRGRAPGARRENAEVVRRNYPRQHARGTSVVRGMNRLVLVAALAAAAALPAAAQHRGPHHPHGGAHYYAPRYYGHYGYPYSFYFGPRYYS